MRKKLVKYGNSTTLVIDKAILELLNMNESSEVKLHTDGRSLIVTPVLAYDENDILQGQPEAMKTAIKAIRAQHPRREMSIDEMTQSRQGFRRLFEKHNKAMMSFLQNAHTHKEFQEALVVLAEKYDSVTQSEQYVKEFAKLKSKFFPELDEFDKEVVELVKQVSPKT